MSDCLVIIPTYNEKENIVKIIDAVLVLDEQFHVLVVDDNSPDGTGTIVNALQSKKSKRLHLLNRKKKEGLGRAYIAGFKWGLSKGYEFICEMDADFSHPPEKLLELYRACKVDSYDLAIGSRYVKGGGVVNWSWDRIFLSRGASLYVQLLTWMPIKDPTAGFKCYRSSILSKINFDKIRFVGYAFQIEMKFAAWQLGAKIVEVPIIFKDREEGVSKMSGSIIKEAAFGVVAMRIKSFFSSYD